MILYEIYCKVKISWRTGMQRQHTFVPLMIWLSVILYGAAVTA